MPKAVRIHAFGGPDVLRYEEVEVAAPSAGEVLIEQRAIGVNFIDTYQRTGFYPNALPLVPGAEGAGEVLAVGEGVDAFKPGDRVAYGTSVGAYAERRLVPADKLVHLPDDIAFETAAVMMLKGLTAQYLLRRTHRVGPDDTVLVHAAAGGTGLILCQWAKALGATVIGTVGSDAKAELARRHGADHAIVYTREDFPARVREVTEGRLCTVVYDGIGKATFPASLDCLRPLGLFVSFGSASGPVEGFDIGLLGRKGSLFATRPSLFVYAATAADLVAMSDDLVAAIRSGAVTIDVAKRLPLADAAEAHRALEARETTGSTVLIP